MGCSSSAPKDTVEPKVAAQKAPVAAVQKKEVKAENVQVKGVEVSAGDFKSVYTLGKVLGKGNFSVVRQATHKTDGNTVAVKCIDPASLDKADQEALVIEIDVLKNLDCPNIIKLHDVYLEKKMYYIVTEIMQGGELFDRIISKEFYSEADAQKVVQTLASAIKYCHDRDIVHRDLKPENILLSDDTEDATIKIADFGFAKKVDVVTGDDGATLSTACGTPGYVAPEILKGEKYGREVDLWSLGIITYILLSGYPPFHDDNQGRLFKKIRSGIFKFDSPYWDNISQEAKDFVKSLLTVDPKARMTVEQVFDNAWLKESAEEAKQHDLTQALTELKRFQARKKWKKGTAAVIAVNKLQKLVGGGTNGTSPDDVEGDVFKAATDGATDTEAVAVTVN